MFFFAVISFNDGRTLVLYGVASVTKLCIYQVFP